MKFDAKIHEFEPYTIKGIFAHCASGLYAIASALNRIAAALEKEE